MQAVKINKTIENDGQIFLTNLPYKKGQTIEMILLVDSSIKKSKSYKKEKFTANQLLKSKIVGLWKNRKDISNSVDYAIKLRNQSQNRW